MEKYSNESDQNKGFVLKFLKYLDLYLKIIEKIMFLKQDDIISNELEYQIDSEKNFIKYVLLATFPKYFSEISFNKFKDLYESGIKNFIKF